MANEKLTLQLDEVELAINKGNWKQGLQLLNDSKKKFRATSGWGETRRRREELRNKLETIRQDEEKRAKISKYFSVPITLNEDGSIKVSYIFDSQDELKDFNAYGQGWEVAQGVLACGTGRKQDSQDLYHSVVGLRFGAALDPERPITISFSYLPPIHGGGPQFMGLSFFGGCLGIRSFKDGDQEGQVNFWQGDLDDYGDYFYVPLFGEERPKKGRHQGFGFERGENYDIRLLWIPKRELLLRIDDKDVYRVRAFKTNQVGIEIKTLKEAIIDSLSIEGYLRN